MADTANVDVILETSFDAHVYEERLKINRSDQMAKVVIQKSKSQKVLSALFVQKNGLALFIFNYVDHLAYKAL